MYGPTITAGSTNELMVMSTTFYESFTITETAVANCSFDSTDGLSVRTVTSLIYPSSCDFGSTTRYVPEITVTRGGSTVTVYASSTRTRTIFAYSTMITSVTTGGEATQTDGSEPSPDPEGEENPDDEEFPEDEEEEPEPEPIPDPETTQVEAPPASSVEPLPSPTPVVANATDLAQKAPLQILSSLLKWSVLRTHHLLRQSAIPASYS